MLQRIAFEGRRTWTARARHVAYVEASQDDPTPEVTLLVNGTQTAVLRPGDSVELDAEATEFEVVPTTPTMTGVIACGTSRLDLAASTEVVIDPGWSQVMQGRSRSMGFERIAGAGLFPCLLLLNTSSRFLTLRSVRLSFSGSGSFRAYRALASAVPSGTLKLAQGSIDKYLDGAGAGPTALGPYYSDLAAITPAAAQAAFALTVVDPLPWYVTRPITTDYELVRGAPIVVGTLNGIVVIGDVAASELVGVVEFDMPKTRG